MCRQFQVAAMLAVACASSCSSRSSAAPREEWFLLAEATSLLYYSDNVRSDVTRDDAISSFNATPHGGTASLRAAVAATANTLKAADELNEKDGVANQTRQRDRARDNVFIAKGIVDPDNVDRRYTEHMLSKEKLGTLMDLARAAQADKKYKAAVIELWKTHVFPGVRSCSGREIAAPTIEVRLGCIGSHVWVAIKNTGETTISNCALLLDCKRTYNGNDFDFADLTLFVRNLPAGGTVYSQPYQPLRIPVDLGPKLTAALHGNYSIACDTFVANAQPMKVVRGEEIAEELGRSLMRPGARYVNADESSSTVLEFTHLSEDEKGFRIEASVAASTGESKKSTKYFAFAPKQKLFFSNSAEKFFITFFDVTDLGSDPAKESLRRVRKLHGPDGPCITLSWSERRGTLVMESKVNGRSGAPISLVAVPRVANGVESK